MSGGRRRDGPPPPEQDERDEPHDATPNALQDWVTLWQSELAAMATDREAQENWQALLALWEATATAMLRPLGPGRRADGPRRRARAAAAPGAAPAAAASDARDVEIDRLHDRIAELERRLDAMERGSGERGAGGAFGPGERRRGAR